MMADNDTRPIEEKIDALVAKLTEGDLSEEGKRKAEDVRKMWADLKEMIVDTELKALMLTEMRRFVRDHAPDNE
jgi:hypothetical protein